MAAFFSFVDLFLALFNEASDDNYPASPEMFLWPQ